MPWLKLLHIAAVVVWCGALLYLPLAIASARAEGDGVLRGRGLRTLFVGIATPAALMAIGSGTVIFLWQGPMAVWLIAKLAVVGLLVLGHAACGMLVLRRERQPGPQGPALSLPCTLIGASSLLWLLGIAWLVLAKPF